MPVCKKCEKEKDLKCFNVRSDNKKPETMCKDCRAIYAKEYSKKNKDKIKEENRLKYLENKESIDARNKEWYEKNKEKRGESIKKYKKENPEIYKNYIEKNKESLKQKAKIRRQKNIEVEKEKQRIYHQKNKETRNKNCRKYYQENKEKCKISGKEYFKKNKTKIKEKNKIYNNKPEVKIRKSKYSKDYSRKNREVLNKKAREKSRIKRKTDINYRLMCNMRARIGVAIKRALTKKCNSSCNLLGCEIPFYLQYITSLFTEDMTWENYGKLWHIDHIQPCCSFDLTKEEEQFKCFNYTNTRPLLAKDNLSKINEDKKKSQSKKL